MSLLLVAVFISYVDRTNISVGAIAMQAQLHWTETQKGMVLSSFFIGYLLLMLASSALANRFGGLWSISISGWWSEWRIRCLPDRSRRFSGSDMDLA